jgi:hypothetical protein
MEYLETGEAGNQTKHKKSEFESLHPREKLGMLCTFDNPRTGETDTGGFLGLRHRRIRGAQIQEDSWGLGFQPALLSQHVLTESSFLKKQMGHEVGLSTSASLPCMRIHTHTTEERERIIK